MTPYPSAAGQRDQWVLGLRGPRAEGSPDRPAAFFLEQERFRSGEAGPVAAVFLRGRECPWRCAMCDLWRHTLAHTPAPGQIPAQVRHALARMGPARQLKLYNSGSFFDPRAIPPADWPAIAEQAGEFERVIVECHPSLVGPRCLGFAGLLGGQLEIAMGLETAHPGALERLNKRMTLADFAAKAEWLGAYGIALRAFVVVGGPFQPAGEAVAWACRSAQFARECGAGVVSLVLARGGNGAMEALEAAGEWTPPRFADLEGALASALPESGGMRVFADLWSVAPPCHVCGPSRVARLGRMNLSQAALPPVACEACGGV